MYLYATENFQINSSMRLNNFSINLPKILLKICLANSYIIFQIEFMIIFNFDFDYLNEEIFMLAQSSKSIYFDYCHFSNVNQGLYLLLYI